MKNKHDQGEGKGETQPRPWETQLDHPPGKMETHTRAAAIINTNCWTIPISMNTYRGQAKEEGDKIKARQGGKKAA